MSRVLALDYGEARCGCALSDPTGTLATPIEVVERPGTRRGLQRIVALVRERDVARVVVGLHDERLTTKQAAQTGGSAAEDSRAAAHLLEAYLAAGAHA